MDMFELFDPRYQLEAEDRDEPAPPVPPRIHEEIRLTLRTIDALVARLEAAPEARSPRPRH